MTDTYIQIKLDEGVVELRGYSTLEESPSITDGDQLIILKGGAVMTAGIPASVQQAKEMKTRIDFYSEALEIYESVKESTTLEELCKNIIFYRATKPTGAIGIVAKELNDILAVCQKRGWEVKVISSNDGIYELSINPNHYVHSNQLLVVTKPWGTLNRELIHG